MKKTFVVIGLSYGDFVGKPMMVAAESSDEALMLAMGSLAESLQMVPVGMMLHCFDTETDFVYVGSIDQEPDEENKEEESKQQDTFCTCPADSSLECDHKCGWECELKRNAGAPEPCTDPGDPRDPEYPSDERVFEPEELLFAVMPYDLPGEICAELRAKGLKFTVEFVTKEWFDHYKGTCDFLGGHNISVAALNAAGICEAEMMESIFEVLPCEDDDEHKLMIRMLDAGFGYLQEFQDLVKKQTNG